MSVTATLKLAIARPVDETTRKYVFALTKRIFDTQADLLALRVIVRELAQEQAEAAGKPFDVDAFDARVNSTMAKMREAQALQVEDKSPDAAAHIYDDSSDGTKDQP